MARGKGRRRRQKMLSPPSSGGWVKVFESYPGAFQAGVEVKRDSVLANHADFACRTLIAGDISKLRIRAVRKNQHGIWHEEKTQPDVLRRPNHFQTRQQFFESWMLSKLQAGNTYVLKQRDDIGRPVKLYVLNPDLVTPLISDDGSVFYQVQTDNLAGLPQTVIIPAREIIHDRFNTFFHPLVGLSPIFAGGLAATQGLEIQNDSASFFKQGARPSGILTAPANIDDKDVERLTKNWNELFGGKNSGRVAVLGSNMRFEAMKAKAIDSQLIDQLKWTASVVASVYHVPGFKIGIADAPQYAKGVETPNLQYYSDCLQTHFEAIEACLDDGLGYDGVTVGTEFDLDGLIRMDRTTQVEIATKMKGLAELNEARAIIDLDPKDYGNTIYLQQQDHSAEAIAARDAALIAAANNPPEPPKEDVSASMNAALVKILKGLR